MTSQRAFEPQAPLSEQGSLHSPRMQDLSMVQSASDVHTLSDHNFILLYYLITIFERFKKKNSLNFRAQKKFSEFSYLLALKNSFCWDLREGKL